MIEYVIYDSSDTYVRTAVPKEFKSSLLLNATSYHQLVFDAADEVWTALTPGARVAVLWDGVEQDRGSVHLLGGGERTAPRTCTVLNDWWRFTKNTGWPKPGSAITSQTDKYKRYTGPTETVVKAVCAAVSTRLGYGWTIPTTTGLGVTERVEFRFDNLADVLTPLVNAAGLSWTIRQGVVDVTEGKLFAQTLTDESGVLGQYTWEIEGPTVTRAIVGGEGEGASRTFRQYTDSSLETEWGYIAETFVDARLAEGETDLSPDGRAALTEGRPRVTVTSELIETDWFKFGNGSDDYQLGDRVHIQPVEGGPVDTTELIRQVTITGSSDGGLRVVPSIGDSVTQEKKVARRLAKLARDLRVQERR